MTYIYDGSFDGLMTCVFESFRNGNVPDIIPDYKSAQLTFFETEFIETDKNKYERVKNGIILKIGKSFLTFLERAYLTCLDEKEKNIVILTHLGFKYGKKSLKMIDVPVVHKLHKAVGYLGKEAHLLKEFLRFSIYNELMFAQITPNNFVLPLLATHFIDRFPDENFMIYDNTHGSALVYIDKNLEIVDIEEFIAPEPQGEEVKYRRLWKTFYNIIGIEERKNPQCRMSNMPKRYWRNLTEFIWDKDFDCESHIDLV